MNTTNKVEEFHEMVGDYFGKMGELEPREIRQLRIALLFEELQELAEAGDVQGSFMSLCQEAHTKLLAADVEDGDNVDKVEELDAICDIEYLLNGKKLTSGLASVFEEAFELVHRNNMDKGHISYEAAIKTSEKRGGAKIRTSRGRFLVHREDGKLLKPWNHEKVDLKPLLDVQ